MSTSEVREREFKNQPILQIVRDANDTFGVQFGVGKAKLILEHIEAIKAFVAKYDRVPAGAN